MIGKLVQDSCRMSPRRMPGAHRRENFTKDVEEFRKFLGLDKVVVIGRSYGGFIGLEHAVN